MKIADNIRIIVMLLFELRQDAEITLMHRLQLAQLNLFIIYR